MNIILLIVAALFAGIMAIDLKFSDNENEAWSKLLKRFFALGVIVLIMATIFDLNTEYHSSEPITRETIFSMAKDIAVLLAAVFSMFFLQIIKSLRGLLDLHQEQSEIIKDLIEIQRDESHPNK